MADAIPVAAEPALAAPSAAAAGGPAPAAVEPEAPADVSAASQLKDDATLAFKQANYKLAAERYTAALTKLGSEGKIRSLSGEALALAANLYSNRAAAEMALKQFSAASADCAESLLLEAGSAKVQLRKARCDLALGEAECAIGLLSEVLEADPGNATARTEKAQAQTAFRALCELRGAVAEGGSAARVVELTGAALTDRCPASAFVKTARANALLALGRVDEAMALATALLQAASDGGEGGGGISALLLLRARCLNYAGNGASAIKTLTECLRQDPDDPTAARLMKLIKRSEALKKEGNDAFAAEKWDLALEAYRSALALDPLNKNFSSRVLCNCATVLFKQGKFGEAVGECNASLAADETYVKAYRRRAAAYTSLGDADSIGSAIRDLSKAKELLGGAGGAGAGTGAGAGAEASAENKQQLREIEEGLKAAQKALKKAKFKDYYKLLELERTADEDDIRKAYKRAALKWHPDRHSSASEADKVKAEAMFKDVTEANTVLNDPQMRARYDESLSSGNGEAFDPSGSSDGCCGGGGGMRGNPFGGGGGGGGMDPRIIEMMMAQMMGGGGMGGGRSGMGGFPGGMFGGGGRHR